MFHKVPEAEIAYSALYYHPDDKSQKWCMRNFAKLNNFSGIAMADRGCDRTFSKFQSKTVLKMCLIGPHVILPEGGKNIIITSPYTLPDRFRHH